MCGQAIEVPSMYPYELPPMAVGSSSVADVGMVERIRAFSFLVPSPSPPGAVIMFWLPLGVP